MNSFAFESQIADHEENYIYQKLQDSNVPFDMQYLWSIAVTGPPDNPTRIRRIDIEHLHDLNTAHTTNTS